MAITVCERQCQEGISKLVYWLISPCFSVTIVSSVYLKCISLFCTPEAGTSAYITHAA